MRNIQQVMDALWSKAADHLTLDELDSMQDAGQVAASYARNLALTCEGIACLVDEDASRERGSGNFRGGDDVFALLCSMAQGFDTIDALVTLGEQASSQARRMVGFDEIAAREQYRARLAQEVRK